MRVCYFGTFRANYARNLILIDGLRRNGVEVIECHETLWHGIEDRVQAASGGWLRPSFLGRMLRVYIRLLKRYRTMREYDVMVLGYPGQIDVLLARILSWLRRRPLVLDCFMSIYLVACERELVQRHPGTGKLIHLLERGALTLPDGLIAMSDEYVDWFAQNFGLDRARFSVIPTGADDRVYRPVEGRPEPSHFTILFYGTFIHTHGILTIVEAARLLSGYGDIRFVLIGQGPVKEEALHRIQVYGLHNVEVVDWVEREEIPRRAAQADLCLGVFGTTPQVEITIQNKIYEALAMRKPVLTANGQTVRRWLQDGVHVAMCPPNDPQALATAILALRSDPAQRERLAREGHALFLTEFAPKVLGRRFVEVLEGLSRPARPRRREKAAPRREGSR